MDSAFREGIINLNTRQFGKVVELIVSLIKNYKVSTNLNFDLFDSKRKLYIEIKSSRVFKKNQLDLNLNNLYDLIINNTNKNRLLKTRQVKTTQETPMKILEILSLSENMTVVEISKKIEKSESATWRALRKLQQQGALKRTGPNKGGYWTVIKKNSK